MIFSDAVARVLEDLGNKGGTVIPARVKQRFQVAQRDLESGKSLPRFLIVEDAPLVLTVGTSSVALPTGFIRWETKPHFTPTNSDEPFFVEPKNDYQSAVEANASIESGGPSIFLIRQSTIEFIKTADRTYNLVWSYYKHADLLSSDGGTNAWLSDEGAGADWLIGETGWRMALSLRDPDGEKIFAQLRQSGRAATFGELIAQEESMGPLIMGANL